MLYICRGASLTSFAGLRYLVFAGGVERLAGEDLAGLWVGGDGPSVVDERFGHASRVALAGVEDPASAGDVVPRDEYLTRWGPGLLRLGAITGFGGYCVSRPGLLRLGAVVG